MIDFNKHPISLDRIKKALKNHRLRSGLETYGFVKEFPSSSISSVKKIDLILWALYG